VGRGVGTGVGWGVGTGVGGGAGVGGAGVGTGVGGAGVGTGVGSGSFTMKSMQEMKTSGGLSHWPKVLPPAARYSDLLKVVNPKPLVLAMSLHEFPTFQTHRPIARFCLCWHEKFAGTWYHTSLVPPLQA